MTVNNWGDPSNTGGWVSRTDCSSSIGYPKSTVPGSQGGGIQWFDPNSFTPVAAGKFGTYYLFAGRAEHSVRTEVLLLILTPSVESEGRHVECLPSFCL